MASLRQRRRQTDESSHEEEEEDKIQKVSTSSSGRDERTVEDEDEVKPSGDWFFDLIKGEKSAQKAFAEASWTNAPLQEVDPPVKGSVKGAFALFVLFGLIGGGLMMYSYQKSQIPCQGICEASRERPTSSPYDPWQPDFVFMDVNKWNLYQMTVALLHLNQKEKGFHIHTEEPFPYTHFIGERILDLSEKDLKRGIKLSMEELRNDAINKIMPQDLLPSINETYYKRMKNKYSSNVVRFGSVPFLGVHEFESFFGRPRTAVYTTILRDPIQRLYSAYYGARKGRYAKKATTYVRKAFLDRPLEKCVLDPRCRTMNGLDKICSAQTAHLCGFHEECFIKFQSESTSDGAQGKFILSEKAVERAKKNIDENYVVVGIAEDIGRFWEMMEHMYPTYFEGATTKLTDAQKKSFAFDRPMSEQERELHGADVIPYSENPEALRVMEEELCR